MNWIRQNPFFAMAIVLLGGLGCLIFTAYSHYAQISQRLVDASKHLHDLQNAELFPSASNLTQLKKWEREYVCEATSFVDLLRSRQLLLDPTMTPQAFQDQLRNQVSALTVMAKSAKVKLPPNFYLGLDPYRSVLPSQNGVSELAGEFDVISRIVKQLIEIRVFSILEIRRFPLEEEWGLWTQTFSDRVKRRIFDIRFVADLSRFRSAFNFIVNFPRFLSVEALQVINSQPDAPRKNDDVDEETRANSSTVADNSIPIIEKTMRLIFGQEKLTVTIRIALLTFKML